MKLILHIGTEKTGTTTTQRWAARNRDALIRQGLRYSQVLGGVSHTRFYLWCLASHRQDEGFQRVGISSEAMRREFRTRLPREFAAEIDEARKSGCHTFLISSELCHSRLVTLEEVQRATEFLAPHFDDIEILCALRPQIDLAVSHASNIAKGADRITKTYFEGIGPDSSYYNYEKFVERWANAFGAEAVKLVAFRRTPEITEIIAARAGIDTRAMQPPVRFNEALDVRVMAMTNAMKDRRLGGRRVEPFAYIPRDLLHRLPCEERLQPGLKLARSVQARFKESNRELTNGRNDLTMADLEPDWRRYVAPGNLHVLERGCAFSRELGTLIQLFNQNIGLARVQYEILAAERHLDLHHFPLARRRVNTALQLVAFLEQAEISGERIRRLKARTAAVEKKLEDATRDGAGKTRSEARKRRRRRAMTSEIAADTQEFT